VNRQEKPIVRAFDRTFLPAAQLEVAVLADTHHLLDAQMYASHGDSQIPELVQDWGARADWALGLAGELRTRYVFHVGDLQQEFPDNEHFEDGRLAAKSQLESSGLEIAIAVGNMDIGDKPDPTMPASWVSRQTLKRWEEDFGKSFHSQGHGDCHFVFLNSQILNSDLPDAKEQQEWLEGELNKHSNSRIFILLHMPPFVVDEDEPGLGSYDAIGNPARNWLLELCRRHQVEAILSGHTHFRFFNRVDRTRIYCLPSTTTTRPGFYEAFSMLPSHQGKADTPKLGFSLLRIFERGHTLQLIRTSGETGPTMSEDWARVLTCTTPEIPQSHIGAFLRLPLAARSDGAAGYPYHVRHRVRDDYPFLACLELGFQHLRFPIGDLDVPLQAERLGALRDEGVSLTGMAIWPQEIGAEISDASLSLIDVLEIQLPERLEPRAQDIEDLVSLRERGIVVAMSPILMEDVGLVHRRGRSWYRRGEVQRLDEELSQMDVSVDRVVCGIEPRESPWTAIEAFSKLQLRSVKQVDFLLMLGDDEERAVVRLMEAMLASACVNNCRLLIDPLQDSDRTASVMLGLLDRLSNPRPAFHVARTMNSVLFGGRRGRPGFRPMPPIETDAKARILSIAEDSSTIWAISGSNMAGAATAVCEDYKRRMPPTVVDPVAGRSRAVNADPTELASALSEAVGTVSLVIGRDRDGSL